MVQNFYEAVEVGLLRQLLIGVPYTDFTPVKVSLHSADPYPFGANEVVGGSYARIQVDIDKWTAPVPIGSGSATFNVEDLVYAMMPTVTVTHVAIWSNDGTTILMSAPLESAQSVTTGATFTILAGKLKVNLI